MGEYRYQLIASFFFLLMIGSLSESVKAQQPVFKDVPFTQDYSIKYYAAGDVKNLKKVFTDRNGVIQLLSADGLFKPNAGEFLYPGILVADQSYRPMADKKVIDFGIYNQQFVYLDTATVFSNAWAGNLYYQPMVCLNQMRVNFFTSASLSRINRTGQCLIKRLLISGFTIISLFISILRLYSAMPGPETCFRSTICRMPNCLLEETILHSWFQMEQI